MKSPCMNCRDRYPGCHGKCEKEDYLKYQAKLNRIRKNKAAEAQLFIKGNLVSYNKRKEI